MIFSRLFSSLKSIAAAITLPLRGLFAKPVLTPGDLAQLKQILIDAELGATTTEALLREIETAARAGSVDSRSLSRALETTLITHLTTPSLQPSTTPRVIMLVGVNGTGKTTTAAKLAALAQRNGDRVLLVAADTFRAAAQEQLTLWGKQLGITVITGTPGQDPAAVAFQGCTAFKTDAYDTMIIDTSGRLHTSAPLMAELAKIHRVIAKQLPSVITHCYITVDSTLGQHSLTQAQGFRTAVPLDGVILTKLDGQGRGGIAVRIVQEERLPIIYLTSGEDPEAIAAFEAQQFVRQLLGTH